MSRKMTGQQIQWFLLLALAGLPRGDGAPGGCVIEHPSRLTGVGIAGDVVAADLSRLGSVVGRQAHSLGFTCRERVGLHRCSREGPYSGILDAVGKIRSEANLGVESLRLRGGYTPKKSRKSHSRRRPLAMKYKILKKVRQHHAKIRKEANRAAREKLAKRKKNGSVGKPRIKLKDEWGWIMKDAAHQPS